MKGYKLFVLFLLITVVLVGGYYIIQYGNKASTQTTQTHENTAKQTGNTIEIIPSGFKPSTLTIKKGDTVTFVNKGSQAAWPASAVHPIHSAYDGTSLSEHCSKGNSFDACHGLSQGESYSFTFDKVGSWKYHDHLNPGHTGTIVVE